MFPDTCHLIFSAANSLMYSSSQLCCGPTTSQILYIRCWKTFFGFLNMYLRLAGPYTVSVASSPPSYGQSGAPGRPDAWRQPFKGTNVPEFSTQPDPSCLPAQPHVSRGLSGRHAHGLLGLLLGISHLLLTEFLCHLGLPLNLAETLAAHLLGP